MAEEARKPRWTCSAAWEQLLGRAPSDYRKASAPSPPLAPSGPAKNPQRGWVIHPALAMATLLLGAGFLPPAGLLSHASLVGEREHAEQLQRQVARLAHETLRLEAGLKDPDPEEIYLVVDTQANRLYLRRGSRLLRTAWISTGSGETLRDPRRGRTWVFETPRGVRRVRAKVRNPVWLKPDWAFLEEGLPVPPPRDPSRVVRDFLGDYALDLGEQIKVHGTQETNRLGQSVSHGCIRMGAEDLEVVHESTPVGARVFIY